MLENLPLLRLCLDLLSDLDCLHVLDLFLDASERSQKAKLVRGR